MENKLLIDKAIAFIQGNAKENLSLQQIAESAGFSLTYFDRLFQYRTGYTPIEYARIYKLTRCAIELKRTKRTILDIALDFGYTSPEAFSRAFKSFYSLTPSEYRAKYCSDPVNWHDLSGKIAIDTFSKSATELKEICFDEALNFCFLNNINLHAEDVINITVIETKAFSFSGDTSHGFLYVSDYNSPTPSISIVCNYECDAINYLELLIKHDYNKFDIRIDPQTEWPNLLNFASENGFSFRTGYDMLLLSRSIKEYSDNSIVVRELEASDDTHIDSFIGRNGFTRGHAFAIKTAFAGKGNIGLRPIAAFENGNIIGLAMPQLDIVRDYRKYDIGAVFASDDAVADILWTFAVNMAYKDNALLGNANAKEDTSLPISVLRSQKRGLTIASKHYMFHK